MKKGLFLLLAIIMVGVTTVKADVAPPVIVDKHITVEVREGYDIDDVKANIEKVEGVFSVTISGVGETEVCQKCEKCECGNNEVVSDDDIKNLKMATIIVYITLSVLVILMIIITGLMIHRRKKESKKDA